MLNLLKAEFFKLKKDKIVFIALIVLLANAVITCLANFLINNISEIDVSSVNGKSIFISSFSSNNMGLIIPIFVALLACREFTNGTIRNKIICGHKKREVYLSMFISGYIFGVLLMLLNALLLLVINSLFFGYGVAFNFSEFLEMLSYFGLGLLSYSVYITFAFFITMIVRTTGLSILFTLIFPLICAIFSAIVYVPNIDWYFLRIINFLPGAAAQTLSFIDLTGKIIGLVSAVFFIFGFVVSGITIFKKSDLK